MSREELDLPGRAADLEALLAAQAAIAGEHRAGETMFVAGAEGSGRTALLCAFRAELERVRPRPVVLAGGFEDGRYVPWDPDEPPESRVMRALEGIVSLAEPLVPMAGLLGQVLAKSKAAEQLAQSLLDRSDRLDPSTLVPRLMRELCEESHVVCLVDDADRAEGGWWGEFVLMFAREVARDLPLLLVLAVNGPNDLGPHDDDEPDSLYIARRLGERGLAQWHPLEDVSFRDLARWTGPASPDLLESLIKVSCARAEWLSRLWSDWRRRGAVVHDDNRGWRFVPDARQRALDPVGDVLGHRLNRLVDSTDPRLLESTRELLACAALEDVQFTADAVAVALDRDRDDVIDFLDEMLASTDADREQMLAWTGWIAVEDESGSRHLSRYRFSEKLDWWTLQHGLTESEERKHSLALAQALSMLYGGQAHRVARAIARLFDTGGDVDRARHYRRMADIGINRDIILWRARRILDSSTPVETRADQHRAAQLLIAAALELYYSGPFDEALAFAQAGHRYAVSRPDQAEALRVTAVHRKHLGEYDQSRTEFTCVVDLYRELDDCAGEASARNSLGSLEFGLGNYEEARREQTRARELYSELQDLSGEAATRGNLAAIHSELGAYELAHRELTEVVALHRSLRDRNAEGITLNNLALAAQALGDHEEARVHLASAREVYRELGDPDGEALVRFHLAAIDFDLGAHEQARAEFGRVLELYGDLGDQDAERRVRDYLVSIGVELR